MYTVISVTLTPLIVQFSPVYVRLADNSLSLFSLYVIVLGLLWWNLGPLKME